MSRYNNNGGYGHFCKHYKTFDYYRIGWVFDRYYSGSRLRYPQTIARDTDKKGALRFCKKWEIPFPK